MRIKQFYIDIAIITYNYREVRVYQLMEDSQIDFATGKVFAHLRGRGWVGFLHKSVYQILATIDFFKKRNYKKSLIRKKEYYR